MEYSRRTPGSCIDLPIDLNLPPQLVQELTDSFKFFDRDGDGRISKEELGAVVRCVGQQKVTDAEIDELMRDVDANGDGFIDLQEFMDLNTRAMATDSGTQSGAHSGAHCIPMHMAVDDLNLPTSTGSSGSTHAMMLSAFNVFDLDKDGFISAEELHCVLVSFGDEKVSLDDCRCMIQCVDEDGDQMVEFREFEALMNYGLFSSKTTSENHSIESRAHETIIR